MPPPQLSSTAFPGCLEKRPQCECCVGTKHVFQRLCRDTISPTDHDSLILKLLHDHLEWGLALDEVVLLN